MDQVSLYRFMRQQRYGVVSSIAGDGTPQSALIGIAIAPDLSIVFDTSTTSRKYANLILRPRCSLVVGWTEEQTIQLEGNARQPTGDDLRLCQSIYFEVWADGYARMQRSNVAYFVVRPSWVRYSDYGLSPPLVWEASLDSDQ